MGAEAFQSAYEAAGIAGVIVLALAVAVVALWRRGITKDRELETLRLGEVLQLKAELQVAHQRLEACHQARLADKEHQTAQVVAELHAQRDALEAAAGAGRDQADALDTLSKTLGEVRADLKEQAKDIAAIRVAKGGGR